MLSNSVNISFDLVDIHYFISVPYAHSVVIRSIFSD